MRGVSVCEEEASSVSQSHRQRRPTLKRLCRVSDEQAAFVRVRSSGSHVSTGEGRTF